MSFTSRFFILFGFGALPILDSWGGFCPYAPWLRLWSSNT